MDKAIVSEYKAITNGFETARVFIYICVYLNSYIINTNLAETIIMYQVF